MTTVLLVEDEADVRDLIVEAFAEHGIEVRCAETDQRAYEILATSAADFGVLVADINLGTGTTGFDVARRARTLNRKLKVIYITGHAAHLDKFGVPDAVMFPKPFYADELADRVVDLLDPALPA